MKPAVCETTVQAEADNPGGGFSKSMNLQGKSELATHLRSKSQIARVITEDWCRRELYCLACDSESFQATPTGSPASDFVCPSCKENYELKSCGHGFGSRIADSGYRAMVTAIRDERTPSLIALRYSSSFQVINLFVVPRYFITEGVIEKRPPLGPTARRAGWVGCNILLHRIPEHGRIAVVDNGVERPRIDVRDRFRQAQSLRQVSLPERGWTVDVLTMLSRLRNKEFTLDEAYGFEHLLAELHPRNLNIRPKIRQQLQVLRDLGFLEFLGKGRYRLQR